MLSKILNVMRVLVDGPTEKSDEKLIPSELFDSTDNFDEAVSKLIETNDPSTTFDFIRLCISIDTSIAYRITTTDAVEPEDEADTGIKSSDYRNLLASIDSVFAAGHAAYSAGIMDGVVNRDPHFSGLTGRFLRLYIDNIGDPDDRMKKLLEINKVACQYNPSTTEAWWLDTLCSIYSDDAHVDLDNSDVDGWYGENDEDSNSEIVQQWYLRLNPQLHRYVGLASDVLQNESPVSLIYQLVQNLSEDMADLAENRSSDQNPICEKADELLHNDFPTTIEDTIFMLFLLAKE